MNVPTVTQLLLARAGDERPGLRFERETYSWAEHVRICAHYAAKLRETLRPSAPPHVGVLADNVPAFSFLLGGCAFSGAVLVGLNPTRRGAALARDVRLADCQIVLASPEYLPLLDGLDLGDVEVCSLDDQQWAPRQGTFPEPVPATADDLLMLIFTSGTSGDPKAVRCTHGKIAFPGRMLAERFGLTGADTVYLAMPMFHSNAIMAGWAVGLAAGATIAMRRRFSASGFLPDVRAFDATYTNYVGKPLSYVLATPRRPDDADNPLRIVYGNEGAAADLAAFQERFGADVVDAFGSTEGGVGFARTPDTPAGSLGRLEEGVSILRPDTGQPCPPAEFDPGGNVVNADDAVGEMVNTTGPGGFAGYYRDPEADAERLRDGCYHTGDLAYVDSDGFCYFAGRLGDWMRVDGENLGTAPIERILLRHPGVAEAAVYALPDPVTGDQVAAALVAAGNVPDPGEFGEFLAAQADLGPKQLPRYLRFVDALPKTPTFKVLKRRLAEQGVDREGVVWQRIGPGPRYAPLAADGRARPPQLDSAWVPAVMKLMTKANVAIYRATGGRIGGKWRVGSAFPRGVPICLLTTTGRRSGRQRTVPLLCMRDGDRVILVASQGGLPKHPAWYRNVQAEENVIVQYGRKAREMRARVVSEAERAALWPRLVAMYADFDTYQQWTQRRIPVVVCEPVKQPG